MHDEGKTNTNIKLVADNTSRIEKVNITLGGGTRSAPSSTAPFQPPAPPTSFVGRQDDIKLIKEWILKNGNSGRGLAVSAFHGQGGIGKTTLAAFLVHEKDIRDHFSDGILWITLGQEPKILSLLHGCIRYLNNSELLPNSEEDSSLILRQLLQEKSILLVIDDSWRANDVRYFQVGGQTCQMLITTRDSLIANAIGATLYELDILNEEQSLKLLFNLLQYFTKNLHSSFSHHSFTSDTPLLA